MDVWVHEGAGSGSGFGGEVGVGEGEGSSDGTDGGEERKYNPSTFLLITIDVFPAPPSMTSNNNRQRSRKHINLPPIPSTPRNTPIPNSLSTTE